ncbi:HNH endonuclease [Vulcanococcus limneticus Candia 3F8]|nr:HNH endonuclease [Vulcanococcus limneticus MW73D5]MCP9895419.1 HNH endonuclease [Vulcanococcus limneticus Candia 3F8]MCP9897630.1 HNH endonuclease [Vulcanococcus limneticus Candia 3B3]
MDPIVTRNQGGSDYLSNLQALCFRCNTGRHDAVCQRKRAQPTSADCRPKMGSASSPRTTALSWCLTR